MSKNKTFNISRRKFAQGGAAVAGITAISLVAGCSNADSSDEEETAAPVEVDDTDSESFFDFEYLEDVNFEPLATYTLELGSLVNYDGGAYAAVLARNLGSSVVSLFQIIKLDDGSIRQVLSEPISGAGYSPYEVRCTDKMFAWVELNYTDCSWNFYAAPFSDSEIKEGISLLASGDKNYVPPFFALEDDLVVWQQAPDSLGDKTSEYSHAYHWRLGEARGTEFCVSPGHFVCDLHFGDPGIVTVAPRVRADDGIYYGITSYDANKGFEQIDQLVLPVSVKPFEINRYGDDFAFSIEANYGYGGLLGSMGNYIGHGEGPFATLPLEPSAGIVKVGDRFVIKSNSLYYVVDTTTQCYTVLYAANASLSYGEYPANLRANDRLITFATVKDEATGLLDHVVLRVFKLDEPMIAEADKTEPTPEGTSDKTGSDESTVTDENQNSSVDDS